jgi:hypothetical protein
VLLGLFGNAALRFLGGGLSNYDYIETLIFNVIGKRSNDIWDGVSCSDMQEALLQVLQKIRWLLVHTGIQQTEIDKMTVDQKQELQEFLRLAIVVKNSFYYVKER